MFKFLDLFSPSNAALSACYRKHANIEKRTYRQWIQEVECALFTPVVMSTTGGLEHEATYFYNCLASLLAHKWDDKYSVEIGWF